MIWGPVHNVLSLLKRYAANLGSFNDIILLSDQITIATNRVLYAPIPNRIRNGNVIEITPNIRLLLSLRPMRPKITATTQVPANTRTPRRASSNP